MGLEILHYERHTSLTLIFRGACISSPTLRQTTGYYPCFVRSRKHRPAGRYSCAHCYLYQYPFCFAPIGAVDPGHVRVRLPVYSSSWFAVMCVKVFHLSWYELIVSYGQEYTFSSGGGCVRDFFHRYWSITCSKYPCPHKKQFPH